MSSRRISGSLVGVSEGPLIPVSHVPWASGRTLVVVSVVCPYFERSALSMGSAGSAVWRRSSLDAFSAFYAALILSCSWRTPALYVFYAARSLASDACYCLSYLRGSRVCLSILDIFFCLWMVVSVCVMCYSKVVVPGWVGAAFPLSPAYPRRTL